LKFFLQKTLIFLAGIVFILILLEISLRIAGNIYQKKTIEQQNKKKEENYTILCLGDSHTRGMGAPEGMDYPSQLGILLNHKSNKKFNVINLGFAAQNSSQLLYKLPSQINLYKPDLIILLTGGANKKWNYSGYNFSKFKNFIFNIRIVKLYYLIINNIEDKSLLSEYYNDNSLIYNKDFRNILNSLLNRIKKNPYDHIAYYNIGLLYYLQINCNEAIKYFQKAIEINKTKEEYYLAIANTYKLTGNYKNAIKYLEQGLTFNKRKDCLLLELGKVYIEEANYQKAVEIFEKGIQLNPLCINFYQHLNSLRNTSEIIKSDINEFISHHKINLKNKYYYINDFQKFNKQYSNRLQEINQNNNINILWIRNDLNKIINICKSNNTKIIIQNYYYNDVANSILEEVATKNNIPFVNNFNSFINLGNDLMKYREPIGYGFGGHPNAKGYGLIAKNLYDKIMNEKIFN